MLFFRQGGIFGTQGLTLLSYYSVTLELANVGVGASAVQQDVATPE